MQSVNKHYSFSLKEQTEVQNITLRKKRLFLINTYLLQQEILCLLENHSSHVKRISSSSFHSTLCLCYSLIGKYWNNLMVGGFFLVFVFHIMYLSSKNSIMVSQNNIIHHYLEH